jgi:hypothetical protein
LSRTVSDITEEIKERGYFLLMDIRGHRAFFAEERRECFRTFITDYGISGVIA